MCMFLIKVFLLKKKRLKIIQEIKMNYNFHLYYSNNKII